MLLSRSGGDLLSHVLRRSTISAGALNGRVRDGIGCFTPAMATRPGKKHPCPSSYADFAMPREAAIGGRCAWLLVSGNSSAVTGSDQAYRTISTGQLNALLHLHLRPIDVVVCHGPQGYLVSRGASRLDAFSGYPVRT